MTQSSAALLAFSPRRAKWLVAIAISSVIVIFHYYFSTHAGGFWRDEVNLINLSGKPSLADMKKDSFPVLMPLLVRSWRDLGLDDGTQLRLLGMLIGLGVPAALWLVAWIARRSAPLLGLALFGLNGTLLVFGDSIRAYGLGCLLIVLTVAAAIAFLRRPQWMRAGLLAAAAVLSVQTLYHNAVLVGAICLGGMTVCARRKNWLAAGQVFFAGLLAALSLLPYLRVLFGGEATTVVIRSGLEGWRFFSAFRDVLGFPFPEYICIWAALALGLMVLAGITLSRVPQNPSPIADADDFRLFAGITVVTAFIGFVLFLWLAAFPSQSWYLLPLVALAAACIEIGFSIGQGRRCFLILALAIVSVAMTIPAASRVLHYRFTNVDRWARKLSATVSPEDYIVVTPWFDGISFNYYFRGSTPWTTIPPLPDHSAHRYDLVKLQIQNTNAIQPVLKQIIETLQGGHRVWLLAGAGLVDVPSAGTSPLPDLPPAPLKNSGWSEAPYTMVWNSQIAQLLADHAVRFGPVDNPAAGLPFIEDTELFLAEGWTDSAQTKDESKKF
ncbi:MAG TPA: hypothetical protein VFV23_06160 [Verrucomicrobiae bacterium]|nr:hypothetical protein [Verrucomicrobiae bacterium]